MSRGLHTQTPRQRARPLSLVVRRHETVSHMGNHSATSGNLSLGPVTVTIIGAVFGVLFGIVGERFWAFYAVNDFVSPFLLSTFAASGQAVAYQIAAWVHDAVINILVATPFALVLVFVRQLNHWRVACVAGVASAATLLWNTVWSWQLATAPGFVVGAAMSLLSVPLAFAVVRVLQRRLGLGGHASAA